MITIHDDLPIYVLDEHVNTLRKLVPSINWHPFEGVEVRQQLEHKKILKDLLIQLKTNMYFNN